MAIPARYPFSSSNSLSCFLAARQLSWHSSASLEGWAGGEGKTPLVTEIGLRSST